MKSKAALCVIKYLSFIFAKVFKEANDDNTIISVNLCFFNGMVMVLWSVQLLQSKTVKRSEV